MIYRNFANFYNKMSQSEKRLNKNRKLNRSSTLRSKNNSKVIIWIMCSIVSLDRGINQEPKKISE